MYVWDVDPHMTPEIFRGDWQETVAGGQRLKETVLRDKDGRDHPVEVSSANVEIGDKRYGDHLHPRHLGAQAFGGRTGAHALLARPHRRLSRSGWVARADIRGERIDLPAPGVLTRRTPGHDHLRHRPELPQPSPETDRGRGLPALEAAPGTRHVRLRDDTPHKERQGLLPVEVSITFESSAARLPVLVLPRHLEAQGPRRVTSSDPDLGGPGAGLDPLGRRDRPRGVRERGDLPAARVLQRRARVAVPVGHRSGSHTRTVPERWREAVLTDGVFHHEATLLGKDGLRARRRDLAYLRRAGRSAAGGQLRS